MIRYDYLWDSEQFQWADGEKFRPCAVVVAIKETNDAPLRAMVCGITHSSPRPPSDGIEIPLPVKQHLGLDDQPSWIITSEFNLVDWNDPGIIPTPAGKPEYGYLPPALMSEVNRRMCERSRVGDLEKVNRTGPAKSREA